MEAQTFSIKNNSKNLILPFPSTSFIKLAYPHGWYIYTYTYADIHVHANVCFYVCMLMLCTYSHMHASEAL
jgi:hypothetical protein